MGTVPEFREFLGQSPNSQILLDLSWKDHHSTKRRLPFAFRIEPMSMHELVLQASYVRILGRQLRRLNIALNPDHRILRLLDGKTKIGSKIILRVQDITKITSQELLDLGERVTLNDKEFHTLIECLLQLSGLTLLLGFEAENNLRVDRLISDSRRHTQFFDCLLQASPADGQGVDSYRLRSALKTRLAWRLFGLLRRAFGHVFEQNTPIGTANTNLVMYSFSSQ